MKKYLSQIDLYDGGQYKGFGALGLETNTGTPGGVFQKFITSAIGLISLIAIIWFVFIVITGGISYMSAGPDAKLAEAAKKKISNGLTGLLITIFGIFLVVIVSEIFGIPGLLNIPFLLENITIK